MDPADLYPRGLGDELADAIKLGPVILVGDPGSARYAAARAALRRLERPTPLVIDPARAGTLAALTADVARQLISIVVSDPEPAVRTGLPPAQLRALQRFAGPYAPDLLAAERGEGDAGLQTLLGLVAPDMAIIVRDAIELKRRWAHDALWTVRGRATDDDAPRVLLLARPHHSLAGPRDAFLGAATTFHLRPPTVSTLVKQLEEHGAGQHPRAGWITATRCLPGVVATAQVLGGGDGEAGWTALIAASTQRLDVHMRLALRAHQLGPRLIDAIAHQRPPYGSVPGAAPALISNALAALRDADLIAQPAARRWQIADPALEAALASPRPG